MVGHHEKRYIGLANFGSAGSCPLPKVFLVAGLEIAALMGDRRCNI
jgi:hypothetical protein